ncbi:MAG: metallophosphoesterase [Vampirovibrionales bacterium]|nr:metallophosphoesterase [Vampirovibrionales bacterium]
MSFLTHQDLRLTHHRVALSSMDNVSGAALVCRLIQLSDLHFYEYTDAFFYERAWALINKAAQDATAHGIPFLVCITGDTIHKGPHFVGLAGKWLAQLPKPAVAIMGNHDYEDGSHGTAVTTMLKEAGITLLVNEALPLAAFFQTMPGWLVGLDDYYAGQRSVETAFEKVPNNTSVIALAHNPLHWNVLQDAQLGFKKPQLVLSGHTHAGHVYIPMLWPIYRYVLQHQYRYGWYQQEASANNPNSRLYVTSGVGSVAFYPKLFGKPYPLPPFRWNTWPEVAVIDVTFGE